MVVDAKTSCRVQSEVNKLEMKDLHLGDIVKLKNIRGRNWNLGEHMDHYCGQRIRVAEIVSDRSFKTDPDINYAYRRWTFSINDVVAVIK